MKIKKIFNNNVVLVEDGQTEMIVMGKGIGFERGNNKEIDTSKIDKKFVLDTGNISERLGQLINEIPEEHFQVSYKIIEDAKNELDMDLNPNIYITLTDHINFAISRFQQGLMLNNALFWEVKKFYKKEYEVGIKSLATVKKELDIELPEEEAGSIALHFVNAQQSEHNVEQTIAMTRIITDVLNIIKYHFGMELDENSINYTRLITHLRYFAYRTFRDEFVPEVEDSLYHQVKEKYQEAYLCSKKIVAYFEENFQKKPTKEELVYFMIHIHRVTNRESSKFNE